ncbi:MAG: 3-isopropylmalate dehydratase [Calditrichaeota bacterium]|nr:MAG: 3-isopropylmalate dehydratase [Calditrichota bacterium]
MDQKITGRAYVLGANIDTDQIIPAEHLVYSLSDPEESRNYGRFALSGVPPALAGLPEGHIPFTEGDRWRSSFNIIVAGNNFGCGSSREHAPFALQKAGVRAVIAPSYARIFYRNAVDGGFVIPYESEEDLSDLIATGDQLELDTAANRLYNSTQGKSHALRPLGDVGPIIAAGGLFAYARQQGMIAT